MSNSSGGNETNILGCLGSAACGSYNVVTGEQKRPLLPPLLVAEMPTSAAPASSVGLKTSTTNTPASSPSCIAGNSLQTNLIIDSALGVLFYFLFIWCGGLGSSSLLTNMLLHAQATQPG